MQISCEIEHKVKAMGIYPIVAEYYPDDCRIYFKVNNVDEHNEKKGLYQPLFYFPVERLEDLGDVIIEAYNSEKIKFLQGIIDYLKNADGITQLL